MRQLGWGDAWGYVLATFSRASAPPREEAWTDRDSIAINLVLEGAVSYEEEGTAPITLGPGSVFVRIPRRRHRTSILTPEGYAEFFICMDLGTSAALGALHLIPHTAIFNPGLETRLIEACLRLQRVLRDDNVSRYVILAALLTALDALLVPGTGTQADAFWDGKILAATSRLKDPETYELPLPEIAKELDVTYPTLRRIFRARHGMSMGTYRIRARLEAACRLLVSYSVGEVSRRLGYPDAFGFSAQFKKHVGMSPSEYRRRVATRPTAPHANLRP